MDPAETLDTLLTLFEELDEMSVTVPIIVEGRKDREALRKLGIMGEIVVLNDGFSILGTCESLALGWDKAIILTDWDRKGGHLARVLMDSLEACDMGHDTDLRAKISRLAKKEVKDVEGLPRLIQRLKALVIKVRSDP